MNETADTSDPQVRVPELKVGDEFGSYHVVESSPTRLALGTNYGLLLILLILGIVMLVFDGWIFQQRVLSHVLLAWNDMTALTFKGAMIVLPLFGIPFVLYSLGRSILARVSGSHRRTRCFVDSFGRYGSAVGRQSSDARARHRTGLTGIAVLSLSPNQGDGMLINRASIPART